MMKTIGRILIGVPICVWIFTIFLNSVFRYGWGIAIISFIIMVIGVVCIIVGFRFLNKPLKRD